MYKGYMIFSTVLALFSVAVTSVGGLATGGLASLDKRAAENLVSQVDRPNTFYRAITGVEKGHLAASYPEHGHPNIWKHTAGDFSAQGAFYAFHDIKQAMTWGNQYQKIDPTMNKEWFLVEFHYEPGPGLNIKTFVSANDEWKNFVNACNAGTAPLTFDIIEGPISTGGPATRAPCMDGNNLVYQVAFTTQRALNTVTVTKITTHTVEAPAAKSWFTCNII